MHFTDLHLISPLLQALEAEGYTTPSPIQAQAIPPVLDGRDVLGIAQTGTGKTAAFALPILQRLATSATATAAPVPSEERITMHSASMRTTEDHPFRPSQRRNTPAAPAARTQTSPGARRAIRALVLAPTRELASQIGERFSAYGKRTGLRTAVIFGGVGAGRQIQELRAGVDVLVACPGRLLDLIGQGHVRLNAVQALVLDEADRMLDMGFIPDIRRILKHMPQQRQTLLFSATMPREIQKLADDLLREPVRIEVAPVSTPAERIDQAVYFVNGKDKSNLLHHLLTTNSPDLPGSGGHRVLVFTRTKRSADRVAYRLVKAGMRAESIHGDKSQNARERALAAFRDGKCPVLVATDLAARGLDVDDVSHVVNFDLPNEPETFVHRIGRTGRAGASGFAVSFCDVEESEYLAGIEDLIRTRLPQVDAHPHHCSAARAAHTEEEQKLVQKAARRSASLARGGTQPRSAGTSAPRGGSSSRPHHSNRPRRGPGGAPSSNGGQRNSARPGQFRGNRSRKPGSQPAD